ncbi:MAG: hypothetical protein FWD73_09880 [Polyangiaceae bacterium]|nr:hypothetical protein [Polyangiaceae bacterium]
MDKRLVCQLCVVLAALFFSGVGGCKKIPWGRRQVPSDAAPIAAASSSAQRDAESPVAPKESERRASAIYKSVAGGFQVSFPEGKAPEVEHKAVGGKKDFVHLFKVQYGSSAYVVTYDDLCKGRSRTAAQILEGARHGVLESTAGTIDKEESLVLMGNPGLSLEVSATTSGIRMRQRIHLYVVNGCLYQVIVIAPSWSGAADAEQDFLDSFSLVDGPGP